ncbi:MAG: methyltransferase domain-containing protein [Dokdonella sp.]
MNGVHWSAIPPTLSHPVITGPDNLFSLPDLGSLLREELARVPLHAARLPAGRVLLMQPSAESRALMADTRHLASVRVHADQDLLRGDVACAADALPWEDDAFQLVIAQHAGDVLPQGSAMIDELARVLAPGGTLLWFGLNPWSPWLAWIHWQARRGMPVPRATQADAARKRMHGCQLAAWGPDYLGTCWPQKSGQPGRIHQGRLLAPLRNAYLVAASKQRSVLTPLRPRLVRERAAIRPQLATPSRRARA